MKVRMLKRQGGYQKGDLPHIDPDQARGWIKAGACEAVETTLPADKKISMLNLPVDSIHQSVG